jgi:DNA-binding response OmpR family regulator
MGDEVKKLSKKEGDFLAYFLNHRGKVVSTDELMVNIWSYDTAPTSATIRSYIKTIRRLLGDEVIETIRGVGYIFN